MAVENQREASRSSCPSPCPKQTLAWGREDSSATSSENQDYSRRWVFQLLELRMGL